MQSPQINFYILNEANEREAQLFACQLIEKAYTNQQRVFIHTVSQEEAKRFDILLWTYRDNSFLPHNLYTETSDLATPIQIGFGGKPEHQGDVLFNFSREIPDFYKQFNNVIEIVFSEPYVQQLARNRYRQYREEDCELNTHKIKTSGT